MRNHTFSILILLSLIGAMFVLRHQKQQSAVISVYVHGTLFSLRGMLAYIPGAADLAYVPDGLYPVKELDDEAVGKKLAEEFSTRDPRRFSYDKFYTFGWSGKLSFEERKQSAQRLSQELIRLYQTYEQEYGIRPTFRIVTFSHGGNVALNLAHFMPKDMNIELILIACPIQAETEQLALSDCFSKVYTIFSLNDVLQVSDPQHIYRNMRQGDESSQLLSKRSLGLNDHKIKQACVSVNGTYLGHLEMFQLFNKHVPMVLNRLDVLLDAWGKHIAYIDVPDKSFRFLNGLNVVDVLKGKRYNIDEDDEDEKNS